MDLNSIADLQMLPDLLRQRGYSTDDIAASKLFRGLDADDRLAEAADAWRLTLIAKGFREIAR